MKLNIKSNKKILITGALGFIGRSLQVSLKNFGYDVVGIDSSGPDVVKSKVVKLDVLNLKKLSVLIDKFNPDWVVHLAENKQAFSKNRDFSSILSGNISSLTNLLYCLKGRDKHLVYFSSGEVYGKGKIPCVENGVLSPMSEYGLSKLICEKICEYYCRLEKKNITIVRPSVVYGPGQYSDMLIPYVVSRLLKGELVKLTKGSQTRDFVYIDDLTDFMAVLIKKPLNGLRIFNLSSNKEVSVKAAADSIGVLLGKKKLLKYGVLPYRDSEVWRYCLNFNRARKILGWKPKVCLEEGLRRTIAWWEAYLD